MAYSQSEQLLSAAQPADERTALLDIQRERRASDSSSEDSEQEAAGPLSNATMLNMCVFPLKAAFNATGIMSTAQTLFNGNQKLGPKLVIPFSEAGLIINAAGLIDGLLEVHKIEKAPGVRRWFRALIDGSTVFCFATQFVIAVIVDVATDKNKPVIVNDGIFVGIIALPALLGLIQMFQEGFKVEEPKKLETKGDYAKYLWLAVLRYTINAATIQSFIQTVAGYTSNPLLTYRGQMIRYGLSLIPPIIVEFARAWDHLPERFTAFFALVCSVMCCCLQNCGKTLKEAPDYLFDLLSASIFAMATYSTMNSKETEFEPLEKGIIYFFWGAAAALTLIMLMVRREVSNDLRVAPRSAHAVASHGFLPAPRPDQGSPARSPAAMEAGDVSAQAIMAAAVQPASDDRSAQRYEVAGIDYAP